MLRCFLILFLSFSVTISFSQLNIDSIGHLDLNSPHSQEINDIWGYVDEFGNEYALVGGTKGTSVVDLSTPSNPIEVFFETGTESTWRDLKTFGDYAYVTTEALDGLLIIDLSPLPASSALATTYYTGPVGFEWQSAHNLYVDSVGYAYIFGANRGNGGVIILDIQTDPMNPIEVGVFDDWYAHDGYVDNDTMYLGHISEGFMSIVDVQDRATPVLLGTKTTPSNFSHNVWSSDGQYAFTTDEVSGGYIGAYDISDPANMVEIDRVQSSPGAGVIPHNTHVHNDHIVTSYYSDGVVIHDITYPYNLVEVGAYDTHPDQTTSYDGCWGVYPFLPSGLIIASDISEGLFVLSPTYTQAAYLEGVITNSMTSAPIDLVDVQIVGGNQIDQTNSTGFYATGIVAGGTYDVTYFKVGYFPQTISVTITNGVITAQNVQLVPIPPFNLTVNVLEEGTNNPIDGANISLEAILITHDGISNGIGQEDFTLFYQENYLVYVGKWGYFTECQTITIDNATGAITVHLTPGIYDDFTFDFGWTTSGSATTGQFERGVPFGTTGGSNPGWDSNNDCNDYCYVTGNTMNIAPNLDDVDGGDVILRSPVMDLSGYTDPYVNYERWFFCEHGAIPFYDSLEVFVSNGTDVERIDVRGYDPATFFIWHELSIRLLDYISLTPTMQFTFVTSDFAPDDNITEAGIDEFYVLEADVVSVDETHNETLVFYPNPSSNLIRVNGLKAKTEYEIHAVNGQLLKQGELSPDRHVIDISTFDNGVYFIQLGGQMQKIVITK